MPKSKEYLTSSGSGSDSEAEWQPKKKQKTSKPEKSKSKSKSKDQSSSDTRTGADGETMYELSKMRFVSVSEFRGRKLINIREYYDKDGETLPGRKGISLTADQWKNLKKHMNTIDEELDLV